MRTTIKNNIRFGATTIALLLLLSLIMYAIITSFAKEKEIQNALPAVEKYKLQTLCLKGVEYWYKPHIVGSSASGLSPKYSPGNAVPDTCE